MRAALSPIALQLNNPAYIMLKPFTTFSVTPVASDLKFASGQSSTQQLMTVTDTNYSSANPALASQFNVTIDWGDGTVTAGTVSPAAGGLWSISGTHEYIAPGVSYLVQVTVHDPGSYTQTNSLKADIDSATDLVATATTDGNIVLSWVNDTPVNPTTRFDIARQELTDLNKFDVIASNVAPNSIPLQLCTYLDTGLLPNTQYIYSVYSSTNVTSAADPFGDQSYVPEATTATGTGYNSQPLQTLTPPVTGISPPPAAGVPPQGDTVSSVPLQSGVHYEVVVTGTMDLSNALYPSDAQWNFQGLSSRNIDLSPNTPSVAFGVGINALYSDANKYPYWGSYSVAHEYAVDVLGTGQPISFNYHDDIYGDNQQANSSIQVQIYQQLGAGPVQITPPPPRVISSGGGTPTPPPPPNFPIDNNVGNTFGGIRPLTRSTSSPMVGSNQQR